MAGQGSHMKKSCDYCKKYVDHLNGMMKCFRRKMGANFGHNMIIPNKFLNHFGGKISGTIELESPKGNVYVVKVIKQMNETVLQCGWEAFLDAHHIEENDSLLFRHVENSRFEVLIFDSDGCEKVFSCAGVKRTSSAQKRSSDPNNISSSSRGGGGDDDDDTTRSSGHDRFVRCQKGSVSRRRKTAKLSAMSSTEESGEEGSENNDSEHESSYELDDNQTPPGPDYVLSRGSSLSKAQEAKVTMLIHDIQPEIAVFVAIMRPSNVKPQQASLVIPKHYASAHFPHTSQTVTLQLQGKSKKWHPGFHVRRDGAGCVLVRSWKDFVRDNNVKEGDICIFQPTKFTGRKFRATVHLLRKTKSHSFGATGAGPKRVGSRDGRMQTKVTGSRRVSSTEGSRGTKGTSTTSAKERPDNEENDPSSDQCDNGQGKHQEPLKFDGSGGSSKTPYILSEKAYLTQEQKKKVEERSRTIQSVVPIYVSIMHKSSVGIDGLYIVTIGKRYATGYLPPARGDDGEQQTVTLVTAGKSEAWRVKLLPRSGGARMLRTGWRDFVRDNGLRLDDICLFQLMNNERRLTMTVHIIPHDEKP